MALDLPWEATALFGGVQGPSSTLPAPCLPPQALEGSSGLRALVPGCSPSSDGGPWTGKLAKHTVRIRAPLRPRCWACLSSLSPRFCQTARWGGHGKAIRGELPS